MTLGKILVWLKYFEKSIKIVHLVMLAILILFKICAWNAVCVYRDTFYLHFSYFFEIHRNVNTEENCEKVVYTHILSKGKTEEKHYGMLHRNIDPSFCFRIIQNCIWGCPFCFFISNFIYRQINFVKTALGLTFNHSYMVCGQPYFLFKLTICKVVVLKIRKKILNHIRFDVNRLRIFIWRLQMCILILF